jgi:acyl phosphate:glycerol-3-phosphate acyltransferase
LIHTLLIVVTSYLLGSIPFGYLLVRIFRGEDVRQTGSGNIGATNVARTGSKWLAVATLVLDALKGYVAVKIAFHLAGAYSPNFLHAPTGTVAECPTVAICMHIAYVTAAVAGFFAIVGHMFPIWLRFRGGKGVATSVGAFLGIAPAAVLVSLVLFVVIVAVTRYVSLGSIVAAAVFPFAAWWLSPGTRSASVMLFIAASSLLIIIRHKDNIRRLLAGDENRFGGRKAGVA